MREYREKDPYRWVIIFSVIPILAVNQIFWLTFAPISSYAAEFYHVSPLAISVLSMSFMIVYILFNFPASWVIDTKGFKASMMIGTLMMAVFGLMRGLVYKNFVLVIVAQMGVAIAQPFLSNSITKLAATWFPVNERATASGLGSMAGYLGMIIAMILTPVLYGKCQMGKLMMIYSIIAIVCAAIFVIFVRDRKNIPPDVLGANANSFSFKDVKAVMKKSDFKILMLNLFIALGMFNAFMTWVEDLLRPRGITSEQAGIIGGAVVIVGLVGAIFLPAMSDKFRERRGFLKWCIVIAIPALLGITFLPKYWMILVAAAVLGFFVMGVGPIAFQYGAEVSYPVAEGTSYGLLMIMGQISGIIFILLMDLLKDKQTGSMTLPLVILTILMVVGVSFVFRLKSPGIEKVPKETPKTKEQITK